ncbi:tRNA ligase-like protein [Aulographum hederae CBS 113979]|uniref:tRNA ligase n=1 Tax=Aulographum hederae CBS 113979 TaxID=1176131 RepID=A0A6G1GKF4_9PEZI|nr:tRNA ligase-like protein [Aulographum hederae CBS 113979]
MAARETAPYRGQDVHEVRTMLQGLESHQKKGGRGGFTARKSTFTAPNGKPVHSWKMQDWDYKKPNLPTYARGLFTYADDQGNPQIGVRGYDKFFNVGEVKKTEWKFVEENTRGPYELSVKENGCIIFMSGMDDGTLLVCSKHSMGPRADVDVSHAMAGEKWVEKHLKSMGKTKEELAFKLREMNATVVAELCDDEFEEHVLAYNPETSGLYLHGINLNLPEFVTYPGHLVHKFADDWGFKKAIYVMEDDIGKVKTFLDHVAETGAYDGRETEGFVIRCQARDSANAPWEDWFFKYKFDEPYLMYRQWRECTKSVIAGNTPKIRKHKKITEEYLLYARKQFHKDPKLMKSYLQNHGIISLRDDFLADRGLKGSDVIRQEIENGEELDSAGGATNNIVIVPVATIGCGKTTLAIALVKLFGWGHFQNDNIETRTNRPQKFAQACCNGLLEHDVMIADRNNHQRREREQIIKDMLAVVPEVRFVALHYIHNRSNYDRIRQATQARVLNRGDNHQTIQAGSKNPQEIIGIMEGFLDRFQRVNPDAPPDDAFDLVIDLDVNTDSRENLEVVVEKLHAQYPKLFGKMPTGDDLDNAIDAALNDYKPDIKVDLSRNTGKNQSNKQQSRQGQENVRNGGSSAGGRGQVQKQPQPKKAPRLEFIAARLPPVRITRVLEAMFRDKPPEMASFYRTLQQTRRIQSEFHVTIIHRASASQFPQLWERYSGLQEQATANQTEGSTNTEPELAVCGVRLERVVWDSRVMCFVVRLMNEDGDENMAEGKEGWETANPVPHVTIGTASQDIKPKESNDMLARWLKEGATAENGINDMMVKGHVVLSGSVRGVLSKM